MTGPANAVPDLLVPITVQALVVDHRLLDRSAVVQTGDRLLAGDRRYSPARSDYAVLFNGLQSPHPEPFFGAARRTQKGRPTDHLVLDGGPRAATEQDRGVHLRWELPAGLRRARAGTTELPAAPDQWLIVRFARRDGGVTPQAWMLDSGIVDEESSPANLVVAEGDRFAARSVGRAVALAELTAGTFAGARERLTAAGNAWTASPTFAVSLSENRNVFSWRDDLADFPGREAPQGTVLSYLVLGWYRDGADDPLHGPGDVATAAGALGWEIDPAGAPGAIRSARSVLHGMVAHVDYGSSTHQGPLLGHPGSPGVGTLPRNPAAPITVGVGNNALDAMISLVSGESSGTDDRPTIWRALEAVAYHRTDSLINGWNAAPRDHDVHRSWFTAVDGGTVWEVRAPARSAPPLGATAPAPATVSLTDDQRGRLAELNRVQHEADDRTRVLESRQQELHSRWWSLVAAARADEMWSPTPAQVSGCNELAAEIRELQRLLAQARRDVDTRSGVLRDELATRSEPAELHADAGSRYWRPADPVVVVAGGGQASAPPWPDPLPCRWSSRAATAVTPAGSRPAADTTSIAGLLARHLPGHAPVLTGLLREAALAEQGVAALATELLAGYGRFGDASDWERWVTDLTAAAAADPATETSGSRLRLTCPGGVVHPAHVVRVWGRQPWAPVFLDWEISWRPDGQDGDLATRWTLGTEDYTAADPGTPAGRSYPLRGRSPLEPVDPRMLTNPLDDLLALIDSADDDPDATTLPGAAAQVLGRYRTTWSETVRLKARTGLWGQGLTGMHQALLNRDVTAPDVRPDPRRPWATWAIPEELADATVADLLAPPAGAPRPARLAPPGRSAVPFDLVRAGSFQLEQLWMVDAFGQWADLLAGSLGSGRSRQMVAPRARWSDRTPATVAAPPRVLQPSRLGFRFAAPDPAARDAGPLAAVRGWLVHDPFDRALVLCDRAGRPRLELVLQAGHDGHLVDVETVEGTPPDAGALDTRLQGIADALRQPEEAPITRLEDLLALIDAASARIRPAAAARETVLAGRPLALVDAEIGLELHGTAWSDPSGPPPGRDAGNPRLDGLRVPVRLGCRHSTEDGLIGFFTDDVRSITAAPLAAGGAGSLRPGGYVRSADDATPRIGYGSPQRITLLIDPWGSVQAACGVVPSTSIRLPPDVVQRVLDDLPTSLRIGPVLLQPGEPALPVPSPVAGSGRWRFVGPVPGVDATGGTPLGPFDPRRPVTAPAVAVEGRLVLDPGE